MAKKLKTKMNVPNKKTKTTHQKHAQYKNENKHITTATVKEMYSVGWKMCVVHHQKSIGRMITKFQSIGYGGFCSFMGMHLLCNRFKVGKTNDDDAIFRKWGAFDHWIVDKTNASHVHTTARNPAPNTESAVHTATHRYRGEKTVIVI